MNRWTKEQSQAIQARNSNLLVAAAAGSGKTAVLVERIIQIIISDKVDIDRLLIVTFTNAAAGEMRDRISAAIAAQLNEQHNDDTSFLRRQMQLLNRASISTLHAFCTELVREHFHLLDIDPKFRIGDTAECELLRLEAVEEIMEEAYAEENEAFLGLAERFAVSKYDTPVENLILRTHDFIQSQPDSREWLIAQVEAFNLDGNKLEASNWFEYLNRDIRMQLAGARELFAQALLLINQDNGLDGYRAAIEADLLLTEDLENCRQKGFACLYDRLQTASHQRLGRAAKDCDPQLQNQVKALRDEGKKIIQSIQTSSLGRNLDDYASDLVELHPYMQALVDLVDRFGQRYQEKKADKGMLDFNDLEHFALHILSYPEVAEAYRSKYVYIFVDEYQDSNLVQEALLNYIKRDDNLFMVGDVKQSIYRFRLADPTLFIAKYENFGSEETDLNRRIDLGMNFRSRAEIIHGVNYIFGQIMSPELGEIEYDERACLNYGASMQESEDASIEVLLIEKDPDLLEFDEDADDINDIEVEASFAARRIKELLGQPIYDPRLAAVRPVDYRDIVILMRSTIDRSAVYLEILSRQGIPVYADVNRGYFEALEVEIFLNLLRLVDNKRQDIPLLSVMRSPLGRFNAEDLLAIRLNSQAPAFYEATAEYMATHDDELQSKLRQFMNQLDLWKDKSRYMPIEELIWEIMFKTGYYHYVGAMPGGLQRQANLRILFDRARQFQETSLKGLYNFIRFVDKLKSSSGDMDMARILGENDNVVRIMSIHKSKGLEFPIVILAGMGKQFNFSDTSAPVLFHKTLGIGPRYIDPTARISRDTLPRLAMKSRIKMENLSEEMRILYVACTRPVNKLIMLASLKDIPRQAVKWNQALEPFNLSKARNFMDWIGPVVMRHPDGEILRDLINLETDSYEINPDESCWRVEILSPALLNRQVEILKDHQINMLNRMQFFNRQETSAFKEVIDTRLAWHYPYQDAVKIPSKLSVSSVKKLQTGNLEADLYEPPAYINPPEFMNDTGDNMKKSGLTGAERGTAMHFVMQHLDLTKVSSRDEIEEQLQEMLQNELLDEEEINSIQIGKILRFFRSKLGQRLLNASQVFREVPFNLVYKAHELLPEIEDLKEELLIQGVIDLYFREGDDLVLVDYKTDYISAQNRAELIQEYSVQVQLYQTALEKILNQNVKESYLYLFHTEEIVKI
ncbi:DNA helicase subunit AddA [Syntrophomonas zehnderi OL-4]|uniref:ATP-dependent helicase/nuclease subunit A n=1 Tax=Syntrophomonas zehnderi OL-4 TaxID=690567 RepID=A0A0E4G8T3_9FIRM|nr:helicase-exonuclease AddAB subunit AddA [Syntrophomonas zehnderi]CFW97376.1 DNA helicase subunit AddA [Syntrophomonas zehnderi OL-4]